MPEETPTAAPERGREGIVGELRVWAEAEVTHGPNWKPEEHDEEYR